MASPIPRNRAAFTLDEIVALTGGVRGGDPTVVETTSVSTDSRGVLPGALFVAMRGETVDGHAHVPAAARAGARAAIVDRDVEPIPGFATVRVASRVRAIGALARAHARRWREAGGKRVVAITGSAGKTTTRVATAALLEAFLPGRVLATRGNLNNRIGVPMMMFALTPDHDVAVLELGTNQPGEIEKLAYVVEPDTAVLTLVAEAHTERLGSIDGVAHEKGALFRALPAAGIAIGNGDDPRVRDALAAAPVSKRITYARDVDADVRIVAREVVAMSRARVELVVRGERVSFETPLLGEAGAFASAAAVAVVDLALGHRVSGATAEQAFGRADVGGGGGRLVPRAFADGLALIDDSYNANPASMRASIRAARELAQASCRRLVLVLGEMLELGDRADEAHAEVGRLAAATGAELIVAVSGRARVIAEAARAAGVWAEFREDVGEAVNVVARAVTSSDLVLVKGSRGVATEEIVRVLESIHDARPTTRKLSSKPPKDAAGSE